MIQTRRALYALLLLLALAAQAAEQRYVVSVPVADMYRSASSDADVVSQAIFSSSVAEIESAGDWVKIQTGDQYTGWVRKSELTADDPAAPYGMGARTARVTSLFASLYREPNIEKHHPLMTIPFESRVEITGEQPQPDVLYYSVRMPGGAAAWIQSGDVAFDGKPLSVEATIALGRRFLGVPYLWAGTSSFGFDCSGFTQMLMRARGVVMPRDTTPQSKWNGLAPVERSEIQPGDLLFFGKPESGKINHTGLYIGNGEFINATRHDHPTVQICRLADQPWTTSFITARRLK